MPRRLPRSNADSSSISSTRSHARELRSTGVSLRSRLQRAVYWTIQNQNAEQQAEQDREQTDAMLQHYDVGANWDGSPTSLTTATLDAPPGGQTGGDVLLGGVIVPDGYIPAPQ